MVLNIIYRIIIISIASYSSLQTANISLDNLLPYIIHVHSASVDIRIEIEFREPKIYIIILL